MPSRSTLGSQTQRSAAAMLSMTPGTWLPQPHQLDFSVNGELDVPMMVVAEAAGGARICTQGEGGAKLVTSEGLAWGERVVLV